MVDEEGIDVTAVMGDKPKKRKAEGEPEGDQAADGVSPKPKKERVCYQVSCRAFGNSLRQQVFFCHALCHSLSYGRGIGMFHMSETCCSRT